MKCEIKSVTYEPGGKWDCGRLDFDADTDHGLLEYREIIPGPRHGDDSGSVIITVEGKQLTFDWRKFSPPEFEAPGKPGRWATQFAEGVHIEVAETLPLWLEEFENELQKQLESPNS